MKRVATLALTVAVLLSTRTEAAGPQVEMLRESPDGFTLRVQLPEARREQVERPAGGSYLRIVIP